MMSFCMVAAQGVMLPIAIFVGRNADRLGRRPIFLVAFTVLPIRAVLYAFRQRLVAARHAAARRSRRGIYQALTPLVIADIMRGTGRYNLAQGAVATTQGVGASISALGGGGGRRTTSAIRPPSCSRRRCGDRLRDRCVSHAGDARRRDDRRQG